MPPQRTAPRVPVKPVKSERTHEENQERAYIAASRRSDRSLEARVESARRASEIHKKRTGRGLRVTDNDVLNEEMYEEEDDDFPRHLNYFAGTKYDQRMAAYFNHHMRMRSIVDQNLQIAMCENGSTGQSYQPMAQNVAFAPTYFNQHTNQQISHGAQPANFRRHQPYPTLGPSQSHDRSIPVLASGHIMGSIDPWPVASVQQSTTPPAEYPRRHMSLPGSLSSPVTQDMLALSTSAVSYSSESSPQGMRRNTYHPSSSFSQALQVSASDSSASPCSTHPKQYTSTPPTTMADADNPFYPFSKEVAPEITRYFVGHGHVASDVSSLFGNQLDNSNALATTYEKEAQQKPNNSTNLSANMLPEVEGEGEGEVEVEEIPRLPPKADNAWPNKSSWSDESTLFPAVPLNSSILAKSAAHDVIDNLLNESTDMSPVEYKSESYDDTLQQYINLDWDCIDPAWDTFLGTQTLDSNDT